MVQSKRVDIRCELTTNLQKRAAANKLAASVKDSLPAGLSQPALRALAEAKLTQLEQLARVSEAELLALHGMGPKGVAMIRVALAAKGLSFAKPRKRA